VKQTLVVGKSPKGELAKRKRGGEEQHHHKGRLEKGRTNTKRGGKILSTKRLKIKVSHPSRRNRRGNGRKSDAPVSGKKRKRGRVLGTTEIVQFPE